MVISEDYYSCSSPSSNFDIRRDLLDEDEFYKKEIEKQINSLSEKKFLTKI